MNGLIWRYGRPDTAVYIEGGAGYWRRYFRLAFPWHRVAFAPVERSTVDQLGAEIVAESYEALIALYRKRQL